MNLILFKFPKVMCFLITHFYMMNIILAIKEQPWFRGYSVFLVNTGHG